MRDLNQTRLASMKEMKAYGARQKLAARRVISSSAGSGRVSRISYCARDLSLSASSLCIIVGLAICMKGRKNRLRVLCQSADGEPLPLLVQSYRKPGKSVTSVILLPGRETI